MSLFLIGEEFITVGGWRAVVCSSNTMFHDVNGGELRTFDRHTGFVKSRTVGEEYDLRYRLRAI